MICLFFFVVLGCEKGDINAPPAKGFSYELRFDQRLEGQCKESLFNHLTDYGGYGSTFQTTDILGADEMRIRLTITNKTNKDPVANVAEFHQMKMSELRALLKEKNFPFKFKLLIIHSDGNVYHELKKDGSVRGVSSWITQDEGQ